MESSKLSSPNGLHYGKSWNNNQLSLSCVLNPWMEMNILIRMHTLMSTKLCYLTVSTQGNWDNIERKHFTFRQSQ